MTMKEKVLVAQPHERRVQRFAYGALLAATLLAVIVILPAEGRIFGLDVPLLAMLALLLVGAGLGVFATVRRSTTLALAAAALMLVSVAPAGTLEPGIFGYALGLLFAVALLAFGELVHMTTRYDTAHKLVEEDGMPEEHLDRVTDEAVKTLAARAGMAAGLVAGGVALALLLAAAGPRALRDGLETAAPLGVAIATLLILSALTLYVLARGSRLRRDEGQPEPAPQEAAP